MKRASNRRSAKRLLFALLLLGTALATAPQWEPAAQARRCCSTCPQDNMEDPCWNFCAFSC